MDRGRDMVRLPTNLLVVAVIMAVLALAGCTIPPSQGPASPPAPTEDISVGQVEVDAQDHADARETAMQELAAVSLEPGAKLKVVATTGIVADVVANVGGDAIELTPLMPVGADPHSFTPAPRDMRVLNEAHAIFVNGLHLEESLMPILENLDRPVPLIGVNAGVDTLQFEEAHEHGEEHGSEGAPANEDHDEDEHGDDHHHAGGVDPHTWFGVPNVMVWTDNIASALGALDPVRAADYNAAAAAYVEKLSELDEELRAQIETLPEDHRKLVTDHVALNYLAAEYGFETVGSVLPSLSTLAAASAQELAALQEAIEAEGVRAVFVSTTVNPQTATQLASDLGIPVVELYTGSLSDADGPAPTYIELMRYDVAQIVEALR